MKKLLCLALLGGVMACPSHVNTSPSAAGGPGGETSRAAVERFFNAVHAGDLQEMSVAWGTKQGPASSTIERTELEKREVVLQCYFNHESYRILDDKTMTDGGHSVQVELNRTHITRVTTVRTVLGPNRRWYVESLDIAAVREFCAMAPKNP